MRKHLVVYAAILLIASISYGYAGWDDPVLHSGADVTLTGTSTINGVVVQTETLDAATGDEVAYQLNYTTNKASSGNDTGLEINMTDTASPGTSYLFNANVGGSSKFSISNTGAVSGAGSISLASANFIANASSVFLVNNTAPGATGALASNAAWTNAANSFVSYRGAPAIHSTGTDLEGVRMIPDLSNNHTGGNWISFSAPNLTSPDADILKYGVKIGTGYNFPIIATPPATQTIAEGDVITGNACGTLKVITAATPVTTNTTASITAPSAANAGCCMTIYNSGANTITIDTNTTLVVGGAANLAVTQLDNVRFCSDGTNWLQVSALLSLN